MRLKFVLDVFVPQFTKIISHLLIMTTFFDFLHRIIKKNIPCWNITKVLRRHLSCSSFIFWFVHAILIFFRLCDLLSTEFWNDKIKILENCVYNECVGVENQNFVGFRRVEYKLPINKHQNCYDGNAFYKVQLFFSSANFVKRTG